MKKEFSLNKPSVGMTYNVYGVKCKITKVMDFGTIIVEAMDGSQRSWKVTGLPFF